MHRRYVRPYLALYLLLAGTALTRDVYAASCPKVVLPNNGNSSTSERAPNANFLYGRAVYLIPESELVANGLANGAAPSGIGWNYSVRPGIAATGSLKIYLENTTDTVNNKSTTWTSAIVGMTLVHNNTTTLPDVAGPWNVPFAGGSGFTYGGHGVYVAFDWQNPGGGGGTASVLCSNVLVGGANGLKGSQSNTSAPTTIAGSAFRPETQLTFAATDNDAGIDSLYAFGILPEGLVGPQTITAVVTNKGGLARSNLQVTLNVTGADPFTDTQTVASLAACGGQTLVSFAPYTPFAFDPSSLGSNTLTVSVPADDVPANNSKSVPQNVTINQLSYKYPGTTASGGAGFNGTSGEITAWFSTAVETQIDAVTLEFQAPASGGSYRLSIREDDGSGVPGVLIYLDPSTRIVSSSGPVTARLSQPVIVGPGGFYVGVRQLTTTNLGLSYDSENPLRDGVFFRQTPLDLGPWADYVDAGLPIKINLGLTLGDCLVPVSVDVSPNGERHVCTGTSIPFVTSASGGTGTLTYQWTEDGSGIPAATGTSYMASQVAPGSFAYNVNVTDDAGCKNVQDAFESIGTWSDPPTATVSGGGNICAGGMGSIQAELTGTGPWHLVWSDGFDQSVPTSPATRLVSPASTTTYTVTTVSDFACSGGSSGSAQVTVNPPPSETAPGTGPGTIFEWSNKTQFHWPTNPTATSYKVLRGRRSDLPALLNASVDSCSQFQGVATAAADSSVLNVGELSWYLVTGVANACEGPVGDALVNHVLIPRIPNDSGTCPP